MGEPDFWNDQQEAQKVINEANAIKKFVDRFRVLEGIHDEMTTLYELIEEEKEESLLPDLQKSYDDLEREINVFELELMLNGPYDKNSAILEIHPGAGGTESQDWAEMLLRLYTRWAERRGFQVETLDYLAGDEAGVKSVTLLIKGYNAYGYLSSERGVHRLVRISPFDASGRRHTSFVSVNIMPELDNDVDIEIREEDLKIDTYRSGGAGGQHVNTTDSAVRITHLPSGIVVTCQSERSQIKNRAAAMKMLQGRLLEKKLEEQRQENLAIRGEQKDNGWGSQIRSYVFHPYSMVKDHRTNVEVGNVQAVMDGDIEMFIDAWLRQKLKVTE
ncbi:peptide chain release factor 2 [Desulfuribacillus stibiiarsenatis]|uniref:Peptide chain release factor 2 n=2 Tax=Desulfuribacillus stibiiarsenatis TaxID=1390249 RepID=A0A1E5LA96_9FIRM|nr:peptide chain release factor 2 [Desulfuribacillus stibiiarsenatis]